METLINYKCPKCGVPLVFDNHNQKTKCEACNSIFNIDEIKENEPQKDLQWGDYDNNSGSGDWSDKEKDKINTYICNSCAGEIVCDVNMPVLKCPYCENQSITRLNFCDIYKPDFITLFKIDKNSAKQALRNFYKDKILLPKIFKDENRIDSISGVYVPFWIFDCDIDASFTYNATNVQRWSDNSYRYEKTDRYMLYRAGDFSFEKILMGASTKFDNTFMNAIKPYDYKDLTAFKSEYLSEYLIDKYDIEPNDCKDIINFKILNETRQILNETTRGFTAKAEKNHNISLKKENISYALMPVWLLNTKYNGKIYHFVMNGQTGKLIGELPLDRKKYWTWFVSMTCGLTAILNLIFFFGMGA